MFSVLKTDFKIAVVLCGLLLAWPGTVPAAPRVLYKGVVVSFKLNIRQGPSRQADVVAVVERNDRVDVIEKKGGIGSWMRVVHKGRVGYVRNRPRYIRLFPVPETGPVNDTPKAGPQGNKTAAIAEKKSRKRDIKEIEKKIRTQEKILETFSRKEVEIIEGLNEIDYALNKARIKVAALSKETEQLEARINGLDAEKEILASRIRQGRAYAGKRLNALYKMNMIGRLDAAGLPSSVFDFFLRQNSMKRIIASDLRVLERQNTDLENFDVLEQRLNTEIKTKTSLEAELTEQIRMNKKETLKREMILKEIRKKKKLSLAAVESLKDAAVRLDNRISTLKSGRDHTLNVSAFSNYRGRLDFPVKGKVISTFGPSSSGDYKAFTFQKGIDIKVERGEPVKSVFKGEVMFAQWLKGYGNLLIINHGDNYYTLYAHVEEIFKQPGERVETGEVVATAGDTGSIKGLCLHFEVRHHGKPVNPMKWLKKGA